MKTTIPKAQYQVGQRVWVKQVEMGFPPYFEAVICGVHADRHGHLDYTVEEDDGMRTDGYGEDWIMEASAAQPVEAAVAEEESKQWQEGMGDEPIKLEATGGCAVMIALMVGFCIAMFLCALSRW
ncbi:MAG TPA: hypothetical protein VGH19_06500 [Verrucomicrobiae bacterium]